MGRLIGTIILTLAAAAVLLAVPASSDAEAPEITMEQDGILYQLSYYNDYEMRTAEVVGTVDGFDATEVSIPSSVSYEGLDYSVRTIGASAFEGRTGIVSVELPQSVGEIHSRAFAGCTSLVDINIPAGVTTLTETFVGCTSLESVMLTGSYYDTFLDGTFEGCTGLTDVAIRWVAHVGDDTFSGCESLVNIDTNHITTFGDRSFMGCTSLERLDLMEGVSHIGEDAFAGCTSLTSVDIPGADGMDIGARAFSGCTSLGSVSIDGTVDSIGYRAFADCPSLGAFTFLGDGCDVAAEVFSGSGELGYARVHSQSVLDAMPLGDGLETLVIGGSITSVNDWTVPDLPGLRTLVLEQGVDTVADGAFSASNGLELIAVPERIDEIGTSAFDVPGTCMVAGPEGCLDGRGVADPVYGCLITYDVTGRPDVSDRTEYGWAEPGRTVVPGPEAVNGCTVAVSMDGADVSAGFVMPDGPATVGVAYDDGQRVVSFYDRNLMIYYDWVRVGDPVPMPEDPYHGPLDGYAYEFMGWEGLSPGDTVTGNASYNSEYRLVMTDASGGELAGGVLEYDDRLDEPLYLTGDMASTLLERAEAEGADGVSFSFETFRFTWMTLGTDDLALIGDEGMTMHVGEFISDDVDYSVLIDGPDGVSVDVDLPWRDSDRDTGVNLVSADGTVTEVDSGTAEHNGTKYVRITADESGDYETFATGMTTNEKILIVIVVIVIVVVIVAAVAVVRSRRGREV